MESKYQTTIMDMPSSNNSNEGLLARLDGLIKNWYDSDAEEGYELRVCDFEIVEEARAALSQLNATANSSDEWSYRKGVLGEEWGSYVITLNGVVIAETLSEYQAKIIDSALNATATSSDESRCHCKKLGADCVYPKCPTANALYDDQDNTGGSK